MKTPRLKPFKGARGGRPPIASPLKYRRVRAEGSCTSSLQGPIGAHTRGVCYVRSTAASIRDVTALLYIRSSSAAAAAVAPDEIIPVKTRITPRARVTMGTAAVGIDRRQHVSAARRVRTTIFNIHTSFDRVLPRSSVITWVLLLLLSSSTRSCRSFARISSWSADGGARAGRPVARTPRHDRDRTARRRRVASTAFWRR